MSHNNASTKLGYFLVGIGIGAVVTLLFAPQSGEQTRDFIAKKAEEGKDYLAARSDELQKQAEDVFDKGKEAVARQKERLSAAFDAGKKALHV